MEEMMMRSSTRRSPLHESPIPIPIPTPTWKLYENPFYSCAKKQPQEEEEEEDQKPQIHRLHLPVSARKMAASFWDLTFIKPLALMESELVELKAQLECECKARKKAECALKKLRKGREALEKTCQELAMEIRFDKAEISRLKMEMEEERKMVRVAEVLREERVQMKLCDAKIILEEKMSQLAMESNKKAAENPHIKRGIKGFVEFPKVVRPKSRHLGKCHKAQLMILLKQTSNHDDQS